MEPPFSGPESVLALSYIVSLLGHVPPLAWCYAASWLAHELGWERAIKFVRFAMIWCAAVLH